ncbi:hypothetical protein HK103_000703 [Boothiomyces macroporosus]|uniref:Mid2 domain-containing protein n=1 Tax=Boothiomyces macroporosus TaxID=261099 RepID=A0AAD5UBL1_9FUNG|nr:hypothetical protein HK103_000703 [Boothiomyces macroporosus]
MIILLLLYIFDCKPVSVFADSKIPLGQKIFKDSFGANAQSLQGTDGNETPSDGFLNFPVVEATGLPSALPSVTQSPIPATQTVEIINVDPTVTSNVIIINTDTTSTVSSVTATSIQNTTTTSIPTTVAILPLLPTATTTPTPSTTQSSLLESTGQFINQNKMILIIVGSTIGMLLLIFMGIYLRPKRKQPPLMDLNNPDSIPVLSTIGNSQVFGGQKDILLKPDNPFKGQTPLTSPAQFEYRPPQTQRRLNQPQIPQTRSNYQKKYNQIPQKALVKQASYSLDPRDSMYTDDDAAVSLAMHALSERLESDDSSVGLSRRPSLVSNFRTTFLSSVYNPK